jgi:hypothetical protein
MANTEMMVVDNNGAVDTKNQYTWITYSVGAWCKRAQVKPSHKSSRPSLYSQIQTPLKGASRFGKPVG